MVFLANGKIHKTEIKNKIKPNGNYELNYDITFFISSNTANRGGTL